MDELSGIAQRYECEKLTLCNFTPFYDLMFNSFKDEKFNLFEIGILDGRSVLMWKDYFLNANIYGIDIDPRSIGFSGGRALLYNVNQANKEELNDLLSGLGVKYRIICDDGSHVGKHIIASFEVCVNYLEDGGFYIIEDILPKYSEMIESFIKTTGLRRVLYITSRYRPEIGLWMLQKVK
jgi:hypothetical protein